MATDKQQHQDEKQLLLDCALPLKTTLWSGIRHYKVISVLGAGGFGITYKVSADIEVGNVTVTTLFVVKEHFLKGCWRGESQTEVLHAPTMAADVQQSRIDFIEEAHRLNQLGKLSPNIVKVNEVFEANATAYYVMEYLDGGDCMSYVKHHGPLHEADAVRLISAIAGAVKLLHDNHLLHLDIKPDNIVLKTDRSTGHSVPVLIDFGIAKHFDTSGHPTSHLSAKGASEGYAPIEQYTDINYFAPEIDVYALGATLYYLLTGKNPPKAFDVRTFSDIKQNLPACLSPATLMALEGAMQPRKFERTSSIDDFLKDLRGENLPTPEATAPSPTPSQETKKFGKAQHDEAPHVAPTPAPPPTPVVNHEPHDDALSDEPAIASPVAADEVDNNLLAADTPYVIEQTEEEHGETDPNSKDEPVAASSFFRRYRWFLLALLVLLVIGLACAFLPRYLNSHDDLEEWSIEGDADELTQAIEDNDEELLRKYVSLDSLRAYYPYAALMLSQGDTATAFTYAKKALFTTDIGAARELLNSLDGHDSNDASAADAASATKSTDNATAQDQPQQADDDADEQEKKTTTAETDDQRYSQAVASNNTIVLKQLANKGYSKAYAKAATIYLKENNYASADAYARRAISAGVGRSEAINVVEVLDGYGYYDNGEHGGKPSY